MSPPLRNLCTPTCKPWPGSHLIPATPAAQWSLLDLYLLEKAFYELVYELNSRPDWVKIPLMGVAALLQQEFE